MYVFCFVGLVGLVWFDVFGCCFLLGAGRGVWGGGGGSLGKTSFVKTFH